MHVSYDNMRDSTASTGLRGFLLGMSDFGDPQKQPFAHHNFAMEKASSIDSRELRHQSQRASRVEAVRGEPLGSRSLLAVLHGIERH